MDTDLMFSSKCMKWATPDDFYNKLNEEFNFTLDPCCEAETAKCKKFFTPKENGLIQNWSDDIVFMNPPYGRELPKWIEKAYKESLEGAKVVCLIPARTDTKIWHDIIFPNAEIRFVKGRLKFSNQNNSAPFPSAVVIFGGNITPRIKTI